MNSGAFDTLPQISKTEALLILKTPKKDLKLSSDYYKAVFFLAKYPSIETEQALLKLIKYKTLDNSVLLAQRKAIEVLGNMKCKKALPHIIKALESSDPYIVGNSAWALQEIGCNDPNVHDFIGSLLDKPNHNHRLIIQSLIKMNAKSQLSKINNIFSKRDIDPSIKGAALVAILRFTGKKQNLELLKENLDSPIQNHRHCAVQDIIDANLTLLVPYVISTPISPAIRMRSICLLPLDANKKHKLCILDFIDSIVIDDPTKIRRLIINDQINECNSLIKDLFSTDFSRSYYALSRLGGKSSKSIWKAINTYWEQFLKDYGALYFLIILFRYVDVSEEENRKRCLLALHHCLDKSWPSQMKFKPQAIFSSISIDVDFFYKNLEYWLDENITNYWLSRYAALLASEILINNNRFDLSKKNLLILKKDSNQYVSLKLESIKKLLQERS